MTSFHRTRLGTEDDIFFIQALEMDPANQYVHRWSENLHKKKLADTTYRYLIAEDVEGRPIGFAILNYNSADRLEWRRIIVARRGFGIGRAFMRDVLAYFARDKALKTIWLDVYARNERAVHVYASLGFKQTGEDHTSVPGEQLVIMEYLLP
ncbi:GNAT family N-acetyltransferase [Kordiimonas aestuarii]|uniref:GNAT family N-acetyltransferase n=1 Tax=Kordiimonas aestuarii TaxID=1005925 RepID=UPI0021CECB4A|nr:GNAT family N-acetyltransferase [Kordiimonas aestuarii]